MVNWPLSDQDGERSRLSKSFSSLLAFIFRLLYNQFAWAYDIVAQIVSVGMWFHWVNTALPYLNQGPVLELGFGTGRLLGELHNRGIDFVGLDNSINMARRSRADFQRNGVIPKLVNGSALNLPFVDHSFPRIASTFPSPYIFEHQTLSEIWRVLSPGGRVVIVPTAWITGKSISNKFSERLFRVTHQSPATEGELANAFTEIYRSLETSGFTVEHRIIELTHSKVFCILAEKPS